MHKEGRDQFGGRVQQSGGVRKEWLNGFKRTHSATSDNDIGDMDCKLGEYLINEGTGTNIRGGEDIGGTHSAAQELAVLNALELALPTET